MIINVDTKKIFFNLLNFDVHINKQITIPSQSSVFFAMSKHYRIDSIQFRSDLDRSHTPLHQRRPAPSSCSTVVVEGG